MATTMTKRLQVTFDVRIIIIIIIIIFLSRVGLTGDFKLKNANH